MGKTRRDQGRYGQKYSSSEEFNEHSSVVTQDFTLFRENVRPVVSPDREVSQWVENGTAPRPGVPDDVRIGERRMFSFPSDPFETGKSYMKYPGFIWGIYRDGNGAVTAMDVLKPQTLRGNGREPYTDNLYYVEADSLHSCIACNQIYTIANISVGSGGGVYDEVEAREEDAMESALFPDIVARQAYAIIYNPTLVWYNDEVNIRPDWVRHGVTLNIPDVSVCSISPKYNDGVMKGPAATPLLPQSLPCTVQPYEVSVIRRDGTQQKMGPEEIDKIVRWTVLSKSTWDYSQGKCQLGRAAQWPEWHNWPLRHDRKVILPDWVNGRRKFESGGLRPR